MKLLYVEDSKRTSFHFSLPFHDLPYASQKKIEKRLSRRRFSFCHAYAAIVCRASTSLQLEARRLTQSQYLRVFQTYTCFSLLDHQRILS